MIGLLYDMNHEKIKTFEEQIKTLLSRGLGIENLDKAKIILAQINDYKLINIYNTQCPR